MSADFFSEKTDLERSLGLKETLSIVIGRIIGSGIFATPGPIMLASGSVFVFYSSWIVGGIATILGAVCYGELVSMMPRSGGPYVFLKAAYPPFWTFLRGWAMFFVSETAAIVAVSIVFSRYLQALAHSLGFSDWPAFALTLVSFSLIWVMTAVNSFGVLFSGRVQNVLSAVKVFSLFALTAACFGAKGDVSHFSLNFWPRDFSLDTFDGLGKAMRYGFFAYSGWEGATYVAEEVKNPRKNLPLSLFLGIGGVMLIYLAVNSAYIYQISPFDFQKADISIAASAMQAASGITGSIFIALAVMVSTSGNVATQVLVKGRTWFAMSRDALFLPGLEKIHPVYRTPNRALFAQGIWASVLLFGASFSGKMYETIIDYFSFTSAVFNISTFAAVFVLRRKYPDAPRPYRAWFYPWSLILVLLIQIWFAWTTLRTAFLPSLAGIGLTLTGLVYYYFRVRFSGEKTSESKA